MDRPQSLIITGRSGCGKGTQADLVRKKLSLTQFPVFYLQTGARFREFIEQNILTAQLSRDLMAQGARQPSFLAVWLWTHFFMERGTLDEHWLIDGAPRSLVEAMIMDTVLDFYKREKPVVIYLNVSRPWAEARLLARGRADDQTMSEISRRMEWFETDVLPAVEYYRTNPRYNFVEINGEQSIEAVHNEIETFLSKTNAA